MASHMHAHSSPVSNLVLSSVCAEASHASHARIHARMPMLHAPSPSQSAPSQVVVTKQAGGLKLEDCDVMKPLVAFSPWSFNVALSDVAVPGQASEWTCITTEPGYIVIGGTMADAVS